jgi:ubiquinone/menaquinone biosynthesis C-methylase UbiE
MRAILPISIIVIGSVIGLGRCFGFRPSRAVRHRWYDTVSLAAGRIFGDVFTFMNLGFADANAEGREQRGAEQYPRNLYNFMIGLVEDKRLNSSTILEVGSGRGGGANFLAETFRPRKIIGLDLSGEATAFSRRNYQTNNLEFIQGDAHNLPFENESFDIVINVESSHCYPDMSEFLGEVYRVLKPGGYFLLTDHRRADQIPYLLRVLTALNWSRFDNTDITANVVAALEEDSERKSSFIDESTLPHLAKHICKEFAACLGSRMFTDLKSGDVRYLSFAMEKPVRLGPDSSQETVAGAPRNALRIAGAAATTPFSA